MTVGTGYLDSSALVKLVVREPESSALRRWARGRAAFASCDLARTEVIRAVRPAGDDAVARARMLLRRIDLIALDDDLLDSAAMIRPETLRSLDAIHLAAALALGDDLAAVITYDRRMLEGASSLGLPIESPGMRAQRG